MKLIHCADLHIGSRMDSKYPSQKAQIRRQELRNAFIGLVEEAIKIGAKAILISGDAFDSDHPGEKDLDYFYGVIASHPDLAFFYLRGNHDLDGYGPAEPLQNLHTFCSSKWTTYSFVDEGVTISGIEITEENKETYYDAGGLEPNPNFYNIAMLHGQTGSSINLKRLSHRNINYLALGHIHSLKVYEMEDKGVAVYSGTLEPRGFDELGEKGFVIIDSDTRKYYFQTFNKRTIHWETLDISNLHSEYAISNAVKEMLTASEDIYRIELVGEKDVNLKLDLRNIISRCQNNCFVLDVIDETKRTTTKEEVDLSAPLINEFVSKISMDGSLTRDERAEAIQIGLDALAGKEF